MVRTWFGSRRRYVGVLANNRRRSTYSRYFRIYKCRERLVTLLVQKSNIPQRLTNQTCSIMVHDVGHQVFYTTNPLYAGCLVIWFYENNEWELYDLEKDKSEMNNVYGQPAYKKVQEMMMKKLKEKKEQYKDPVTLN
jgi:hypothetical protein